MVNTRSLLAITASIAFITIMIGCTAAPTKKTFAIQPDGVPRCPESIPWGGFAGGSSSVENIANFSARPYHSNDMLYMMMGPMCEEKMILLGVAVQNIGSSSVQLSRDSIKLVGDGGVVISALTPDEILRMSRGNDTSSKNFYETSGEGVLQSKFVSQMTVNQGEEGEIGIAFPFPLPANPNVQVRIGSIVTKLPICWSSPK